PPSPPPSYRTARARRSRWSRTSRSPARWRSSGGGCSPTCRPSCSGSSSTTSSATCSRAAPARTATRRSPRARPARRPPRPRRAPPPRRPPARQLPPLRRPPPIPRPIPPPLRRPRLPRPRRGPRPPPPRPPPTPLRPAASTIRNPSRSTSSRRPGSRWPSGSSRSSAGCSPCSSSGGSSPGAGGRGARQRGSGALFEPPRGGAHDEAVAGAGPERVAVAVAGVPGPHAVDHALHDGRAGHEALGLPPARLGERGVDVGRRGQAVEGHPRRRGELVLPRVAPFEGGSGRQPPVVLHLPRVDHHLHRVAQGDQEHPRQEPPRRRRRRGPVAERHQVVGVDDHRRLLARLAHRGTPGHRQIVTRPVLVVHPPPGEHPHPPNASVEFFRSMSAS